MDFLSEPSSSHQRYARTLTGKPFQSGLITKEKTAALPLSEPSGKTSQAMASSLAIDESESIAYTISVSENEGS